MMKTMMILIGLIFSQGISDLRSGPVWSSPGCITVPSLETFQVYIDSDGLVSTGPYEGYDYVIRGSEPADIRYHQIRTATAGVGAGGWGETIGLADSFISGTTRRVSIPGTLSTSTVKVLVETYDPDGRMLTRSARVTPGTACPSGCPIGDFNGDCEVDLLDYSILLDTFGQ